MDVADKIYKVGLLHVHAHHALVNLTQVHHLVDEVDDTLGIALNGLIYALPLWVAVLFHQREQRGNDKRHRGANLMTDIHEEAQLGLAHLLGMDMLLKTETCLFLSATVVV